MQAIGIDIGYGNVKVNNGGEYFCFPSIVGNYQENISIGFDYGTLESVEVAGEKFLVGESAHRYSSRHYNSRSRDWIESVPFKVLLKHALARGDVSGEAFITTGLPVDFRSDKERLATVVREVAEQSGVTAHVYVLPQPVGTFLSLLFDERGSVLDSGLASSRVGILDIGYYTTDLVTIDAMTVVERQLASFRNGVSTALEVIRRDLADIYKLQIDIRRVEDAVRRGRLTIYGEEQNINVISAKRLGQLEAEIKAQTQTIWGNAADLDRVILTGGGAALLSPYLDLYRHATVTRNAAEANAAGFYRNSLRRSRS